MNQFLVLAPAQEDIIDILAFIGETNPDAAKRFANSLREKFQRLAAFPQMGRTRNELAVGLRSFPVGRYIVYY